jgi:hypothetical protein
MARLSRRTGRAALLGVALLVPVLAAVLWVVPSLLDWNRYRDSIAALASSGIGRPVRIGGAISLHLLPQPVLTAAKIAVDDTGDGVVLTAGELRLQVALGPLLAGKIDARDLTLRGADLRLPWPPAPGALTQRPPIWLTGLQARVEDSRIEVGGLAVTAIDASLATDPDTGTLSAVGVGQVGARPWHFTARLARPGRDDAAGLEISLDGQGTLRDTGGTFSGQIAGDGALSGRVAGRGRDLSQLLPGPSVPWRADGRLSASAGLVIADELALEIGGSPARGTVALRVLPKARLDLALAASRLDLDAWLPVLMRATETAMPTGIDLSAEAATLAGGTLRRLSGAFDLDVDGATVRDATAFLPGDARLTLSGRLPSRSRPDGAAPQPAYFEGSGHLGAPDLRATLRWLEPLMPTALGRLPSGVLRTVEATAKISVGAGQVSLADVQGMLDGDRLTGSLGLKLGSRLSLGAVLSFDRLMLDTWLPDPSTLATPAGMNDALTRAAAVDADMRLQIQDASWRRMSMGQIALDAQSDATRLTLRRFEGAPLGMRMTASGTVGEGGRVTDGRVELTAPDLAVLRGLASPRIPALLALLRGSGDALLQLAGPPDALAARLSVEASDLRLDAQPTVNLIARRWAGPVTLRHPGAPRLLEQAGVSGTAAWLGDGSLSMLAQVTAAEGSLALDRFDLVAGTLRASGQLNFDTSHKQPSAVLAVSGQIAAETLPLPLPYLRSPDPIAVNGLLGWQAIVRLDAGQVLLGQTPVLHELSADLALQDGTLSVAHANGRLNGGTVSGTAAMAANSEPPRVSLQADVAGAVLAGPALDTALDLTAGVVDAKLDLTAAGYSPAALLATLSGSAAVSVRDGTISGMDIPAAAADLADADRSRVAAQVSRALTSGVTPFSLLDLPLQARRGVLSGDGVLASPAGEARLSGSVDLLGAAADLRIAVRPGAAGAPPGPELGLRVIGPETALVRTPELAGLSLWLAEQP